MCRRRFGPALPLLFLLVGIPFGPLGAAPPETLEMLDSAFESFWRASEFVDRQNAATIIQAAIQTSGASFEEIYGRLAKGPPYAAEVERGIIEKNREGVGKKRHPYVVFVPDSYNPTHRYAVHFYLHGGVDRPKSKRKSGWWQRYDTFRDPQAISVFPVAWRDSLWWQASQVENLSGILDELKRDYNVDENRAYLFGVSDGGTGVYFQALRAATPWAAFLPFIGHPGVLDNPAVAADGDLFAANATGRALFVVNAENDRLYPVRRVKPFIDLFRKVGARVTFRAKPGGHDTRWWNSERGRVSQFLKTQARVPLPDDIRWETERTDRYHRFAWLLIEGLGSAAGETALPDVNDLESFPPPPVLGVGTGDSEVGVAVSEVDKGSLAERAGIRKRDVIVSVDSVQTPTVEALGAALFRSLQSSGHGTDVPVEVERDGERVVLSFHHPKEPAPELSPAFSRSGAAGRVELTRQGNEITVRTRGVTRYRLLLSPAQFDLSQPVRVMTNGTLSFEGTLSPSVETLLKWASHDFDRSMLFAAELPIELKGNAR